jgi:SHS family lactate transporter-like MFS transporter
MTLTYPELASTFNVPVKKISLAITFVLMSRPVGAAIFGVLSDRYGRRWPFIFNNILLIILELSTGFCKTYKQLLAVRALFGIAMGGLYGNAAAMALEDCPEEARGLMSGIFQSGYPFGYVLAAVFWKAFDAKTRYEWRPLFWFGACPPVLLIAARWFLPETYAYRSRNISRSEGGTSRGILVEAKVMVRMYWVRILYLIFLMAGFHYMVSFSCPSSGKRHSLTLARPTALRMSYP